MDEFQTETLNLLELIRDRVEIDLDPLYIKDKLNLCLDDLETWIKQVSDSALKEKFDA